jgi:hypothetical protein
MEAKQAPDTPRELTDDAARQRARWTRDRHWEIAARIAEADPLWVCWWNKNRRHDAANTPDDLLVCSLIDGMEIMEWLNSHAEWWSIGEWSDERYAAPVTITAAGRAALDDREQYDMEPVTGGLVQPGWTCIPAPRAAIAKAESR